VRIKNPLIPTSHVQWRKLQSEAAAISALVPGRTKARQCTSRWHGVLDYKSDETIARVGKKWTKEDVELKDAVEKHNGEDWAAIAALVPGRKRLRAFNARVRLIYCSSPVESHQPPPTIAPWSQGEVRRLYCSKAVQGVPKAW
jgi:hypothetical protein